MKRLFDYIIRKFVKDYTNVHSKTVREAYGAVGGTVGIIINTTILIIELVIGLTLNSIAVTADAFHNLTDALSSVITIISFKLANRPADDKHPFGYGRVEYLTALLFAGAILVVGFEFLKNSVGRILHPVNIGFSSISFFCMLVALPMQILLNRFTNYMGNIIDSSALKASALESFTDILVIGMVIFSLLVTRFTTFPIDGYIAFIVSLFILHSGFELGKDTIGSLLGKVPDSELVENIQKSLLEYPFITGVHDLVIHNYGPGSYMVSLHAEVPYDVPLMELHEVIDRAEKEIGNELNLYMSIHIDPIKTDSPEMETIRLKVEQEISKIKGLSSMHDFRIVGEKDDKTLIFDVVTEKTYYTEAKMQELKHQIERTVQSISSFGRIIVNFDREFY